MRKVKQFTKMGEFVCEHRSIAEALKSVGKCGRSAASHISAVCKGERVSAFGFVWKSVDLDKERKTTTKWNKDACYSEAKKYMTRTQFARGCYQAYIKASKNGWIEDYSWFVDGKKIGIDRRRKYTRDVCWGLAMKCKRPAEFQKRFPGAYQVAHAKKWDKDYVWWKRKRTWTVENLKKEASKYTRLKDFMKYSPSAYTIARRRGMYDVFKWLKRCASPVGS